MGTDTYRAHNFSAGPAALPTEVLEQARDEMLNWQDRGLSVMEISHRNPAYMAVAKEAEQDLRDLLSIPDNYRVIFMSGGATSQFAMVPLNLLGNGGRADYVDTGHWSLKAIREGGRFGEVNVVCSSEEQSYTTIPDRSEWKLDPEAAYVHYTPNETIGGLEFMDIPDVGDVPLVADMSSTILSRSLDVSKYGVIYAGAQKNIGQAGITVVIIRDDLLGKAADACPTLWNYQQVADNDSMLNTPPTFALYICGLVFKWLKRQGGVEAMEKINKRKAEKLYKAIDSSDFYSNPIDPRYRSWMNVPFRLKSDDFNAEFLQEAEKAGLLNLKGHRAVGGMRASIYNAVSEDSVDALISFMAEFERKHD
ncbi:3-phosphoserine/phosphohydroxythreonine transaminase [Sansalvadorimonas sp. 2012CJ34-2]|uniref:Phosphoserine aminotransferase n=1 Tax=Parendozoicomonas callyspongiae TaxID=2942213 RepID=A0ABT0PIY1_9GAMM|nr:3-phosphoserine/phosphohydroxythreonine transaminase [Sansalvadorimonas sp. 2012CJ34-2]MCL6271320.1 3-phosphoserine/phosphohydroxythreonine transaminase [Sansalvadorimonas sp. 2012CJ34-2]